MPDIFISYKAEDRPTAELIARSLEDEGFKVWWDPVLRAGEDYQEVIDANLRSALVVVVLWSPLSVKSRWVRSEATVGDRQGALVPVTIRACDRPLAFELVQTANLSRWQGDRDAKDWRQFIDNLQAKLAARRADATSQHPPVQITPSDLESLFWSSIKDSSDASDFESYLSRYPTGHFIDLARRRLEACKKPPGGLRQWPRRAFVWIAVVVSVGVAIALSTSGLFKHIGDGGGKDSEPSIRVAAADKIIEVWFAGSPHRAEEPLTKVSSRILDPARTIGYSIKPRGYFATDFLPELRKAAAAGKPPDIIFVDNMMHVSGGKTALGSFEGMQSDSNLRGRLSRVDESLSDLGRGWAFLFVGSPDHQGAKDLVAELSGCATPMPTPGEESLRRLQLQAEAGARDFLQCSQDSSLYDRAALARDCAKQETVLRRVAVCRITAAAKIAFVETAASIESQRNVGRRSIVSVHRFDDGWRLLAVSSDPVSTGETVGRWRELASLFAASGVASRSASLETPDGVLPSAAPGDRFGNFTWLPAKGAAIGQVVEMNYGADTRLFVLGPAESQLSTGRLWTTGGPWRWRVWTIGADGAIALSETRSFQH